MRPVSIFRRKRPLKINHASSIAASFFTLLHLQSCCAPGCSLTLLLPTAPSERPLGRTIPLCSESTCFPLQAVTSLIHPSETVIFSSLLLALSHCDFLPPQATREATSLPAALHHWCGFSVIWFSIPASSLLLNINYAPLKPLVSLPVQHNFNTFLFLRGFFLSFSLHPFVITLSLANHLLSSHASAFRNLSPHHSDVPIPQSPVPSPLRLLLAAFSHLILEKYHGKSVHSAPTVRRKILRATLAHHPQAIC